MRDQRAFNFIDEKKTDFYNRMNESYLDKERILSLNHDLGFYKGLFMGVVLAYFMILLSKFYAWMFSI